MRSMMLLLLLGPVPALTAQTGSGTQVSQLVKSFTEAEQACDTAALAQMISDRFVEVSPAGEIDARDRFLSFYTPDKKAEWPHFTMTEQPVRVFGDTAIDIVTFRYDMPGPGGTTTPKEIRSVFYAQRENGRWKLIGTQHTGVRVPAGAPAE